MNSMERARELIRKITGEGTQRARPLPWTLWTSCSFRRIGSAVTRGDGDVLSAYNQQDGHPDLTMPEYQLQALVDLVNLVPDLLAALQENEGWQPIESAPKDGTVVLLWGCDEDEWEDAEDEERAPVFSCLPGYVSLQKHLWWSAAGGMRQVMKPTHWRPRPSPPSLSGER